MAIAASAFLVISLWLAVVVGPQMRMWPWGPALLALAAALGCAAVAALRAKRPMVGPGTLALGLLVSGWFAWRAWTSPVAELAHADLLLLAAAVGCFLITRSIAHDKRAEAVFLWGLAALLLANVVMVGFQITDVDFSQFRRRPGAWPSGFYGHYNEGANFLIGAAFLLMGGAWFSQQSKVVKCLWLLIAVAGLVAVWFTRSRGAFFGVIVGVVAFAAFLVVIGSKRKSTWFAPAMIAFPLILLALGFALYFGWDNLQKIRSGGNHGVVQMLDNTSRLRNYSLAFDATLLNPVAGGGSRSYSWTSLQVWDAEELGRGGTLPEQTHNEILQAATDYGLVGAVGVLALLGWLSLRGLWRCKFDEEKTPEKSAVADALRLGGMAALAGMLVQSSFSFVFHLLPGAMLLGLALGRLAAPSTQSSGAMHIGRFATAAMAVGIAVALVWPGMAGTRALAPLMPVYYKIGVEPDVGGRIERFTQAIGAWPQSDLYVSRAMIHHRRAIDEAAVRDLEALELALADYMKASEFNAKFPAHFVNAANLASLAGDAKMAESLYEEAVRLQGNMEPAFLALFHQAEHFRRKGVEAYLQGDFATSVLAMESALASFHQAAEVSGWLSREAREQRNSIYLGLAMAQQAAGDPEGAFKTFEAAMIPPGNHAFHYHVGMLQYRRAMAVWHQRQPEKAVPLFRDARQRLQASLNHLPSSVARDAVQEDIKEIDGHLALLRAAGFGSE